MDDFSRSVEMGLRLSKRIYYGKDKDSMLAPKQPPMEKMLSSSSTPSASRLPPNHRPTAPMVYAVITEPTVVDNPEIRSYQPYVYGRCDPPALIPLQMHGIEMEVECYLDTAFVTVTGTWRVHCVMSGACCDCRIAIPMGEQGSVLGLEVESPGRSYFTQLITSEDGAERVDKAKDGFLMKGNTYTLKVTQVEGGSDIFVKVRWFQKLLYQGHQFRLSVPFTFPAHVFPVLKRISNREKILLNVNSGTGSEIICNDASHPTKELRRSAGELSFAYDAEVRKWSTQDFYFAYSVSSNDIFGGLLLDTPSLHDYDQREMFCLYLFPGSKSSMKPFRKEVVFVVDISASMRGDPLENTKDVLLAALSKLNPGDSFNIIAFNGDMQLLSSSLELVNEEAIANATEWVCTNFIAEGGTNLLRPLKQAVDMVGNTKTCDSIPLIFLITDGTVEDEQEICNMMKHRLKDRRLNSPRIFTFGIGSYCNHCFLQMLAHIGRGYFDAAQDVDSISDRLNRLFSNASTPVFANVTLDALEKLESYELYPFCLPDLSSGSPLIVSGRYQGSLPDFVKARGFLADLSTSVIDIRVRKAKDIPINKVCARMEIDFLTANAWLDQNIQQEERVAKMSLQIGVPSEYTRMILVQNDRVKAAVSALTEEKCSKLKRRKIIYLKNLSVGYGDLNATTENLPPRIEELKLNEPPGKVMQAASSCWGVFLERCCCMCFIQACARLNDQCAIAMTQLCTALACFECLSCCCDMCDSCSDLCQ